MEIDLTQLAQVLSNTITQTLISLQEQNTKPVLQEKKKRGRPKKEQTNQIENIPKEKKPYKVIKVGDMEEKIDDILEFEAPLPSPQKKKNDYIAAAKRVGSGDVIRSAAGLEEVKRDPNRKIKFIDDPSVGDRIDPSKYPERSDRRPPAQIGTFNCDVCHKDFQGSYKEFPQALEKFRDAGLGINNERPLVKCNNCATRPVGNY